METVRLTVGQAIVRFLAQQYVERDGDGTGSSPASGGSSATATSPASARRSRSSARPSDMPYYRPQNEQAQVHLATAFARHKQPAARRSPAPRRSGPARLNMITARRRATVNRLPVLLLPSDYFANRLADPVLQQIEHPVERDVSGERRVPPGLPVLRPHLAARAAPRPACPKPSAC